MEEPSQDAEVRDGAIEVLVARGPDQSLVKALFRAKPMIKRSALQVPATCSKLQGHLIHLGAQVGEQAEFGFGDRRCRLARGEGFDGLAQLVELEQFFGACSLDESAGSGHMVDEALGCETADRFAHRIEAAPNFSGQLAGDESLTGGVVAGKHTSTNVFVSASRYA